MTHASMLALLSELRRRDVRLWVEEGRLRFSAPPGALTESLRDRLSAAREEILEFLRSVAPGGDPEAPPLSRQERGSEIPLSFAQQRLWFLDRLLPGNPAYNVPTAFRVRGRLDAGALERSLAEIAARHEALRTAFPAVRGVPRQVVLPVEPFPLGVVDLGAVPEPRREARSLELAGEETRRPFDLERGRLFRAVLFRIAEDDHLLLLVTHHIVSDGWSDGVIHRELVALYGAFAAGRPSPLPPPEMQYADFALWQREWLQRGALRSQLDYWKRKLSGAPPVLELPSDRPRPSVQSFRGAKHPVALGRSLSEEVRATSQRDGRTAFMTLLAAFQALLFRYTGQGDLCVGSGIANRTRSELHDCVGFFVNTLVLRTDLSDDPSFRALGDRVRETALEAYAHQDLPFERLVEELSPQRDPSYNPLFQVNFGVQEDRTPPVEVAGLSLRRVEVDSGTSMFDLHFFLEDTRDGFAGWIEYSTDLFDAGTISRMFGHYRTLLEGALADPERRVTQLPLLPSAERRQLLVEWNTAPQAGASAPLLLERFRARVRESPHSIAVSFGEEKRTYRELDERTNRLARRLRGLGAGPEVLVGLCLDRSLDLVEGILGILKAGGAYVPLDPSYPAERLAFVLEDAGSPLVLTEARLSGLLPERVRRVHVDSDREEIARESAENPGRPPRASDAAYVIYTSGSTGRPKGVVVTHGNAARLFSATEPWFSFGPQDVWTLFHSASFDFSVWEMWGALIYGGRLVVVPYWVSRSPEAFYELLVAEGVTVLNQTPSAFRMLSEAEERLGPAPGLAVRYVIFGGEALDPGSLAPWFRRHGEERPRLVNMYGITETTVHVTYRPLTAADARGSGSRIGRPIPDLRLDILDGHREPVPIGVRGEIYVGGAGVARGYLNRPELTAERFLPDPHREGERVYRTGDVARFRADGDVEYLGRSDQQVKIRGFRIEPGEIESVLVQHPGVRQAVVAIRPDRAGEPALVAYVVPAAGDLRGASVREFLRERLPDYMIPLVFLLDALPTTPSGKVDRRALPDPASLRAEAPAALPTRGRWEEAIAAVWRETLGLPAVGPEDNFFDLGGHSILLVQVHAKLREITGRDLPLVTLFQYPTVRSLAEHLGSAEEKDTAVDRARDRALLQREALARRPGRHREAKPYG